LELIDPAANQCYEKREAKVWKSTNLVMKEVLTQNGLD